jgi:hypothetical protein
LVVNAITAIHPSSNRKTRCRWPRPSFAATKGGYLNVYETKFQVNAAAGGPVEILGICQSAAPWSPSWCRVIASASAPRPS